MMFWYILAKYVLSFLLSRDCFVQFKPPLKNLQTPPLEVKNSRLLYKYNKILWSHKWRIQILFIQIKTPLKKYIHNQANADPAVEPQRSSRKEGTNYKPIKTTGEWSGDGGPTPCRIVNTDVWRATPARGTSRESGGSARTAADAGGHENQPRRGLEEDGKWGDPGATLSADEVF